MTNFTVTRTGHAPTAAYGDGYGAAYPYDEGYAAAGGHAAEGYGSDAAPVAAPVAEPLYVPRAAYVPALFLGPVLFCGVSWAGNGMTFLTDLGFITLALLCLYFLAVELVRFPQRFGIGALIVYGG